MKFNLESKILDVFSPVSTNFPLDHIDSNKMSGSSNSSYCSVILDQTHETSCSSSTTSSAKVKVQKVFEDEDYQTRNPNTEDNTYLNSSNYFNFLDDFIRFDVCRTGKFTLGRDGYT